MKILLISIILLLILILALYKPINFKPSTQSRPSANFDEAINRLLTIQTSDKNVVLYPGCASQVMIHDKKAKHVIVLLHGYRNCPSQFSELGAIFHKLGYNVIIPRMPHHGLADVLTTDQAQLTADELAAYVTEVIDIAQGLGEQVTVVGMSTGGVLAGWVAQNRNDVEKVVLIAPVFGLYVLPDQFTTPVINLFQTLPNFFLWQDNELKADVPNPPQVYPQNSTRALSQILRLGSAVRTSASQSPSTIPAILVVTNASDTAVDDDVTYDIVASWEKSESINIQTYEFEANLQLDHDLIDPTHPKENVDIVYPVLVDLITR